MAMLLKQGVVIENGVAVIREMIVFFNGDSSPFINKFAILDRVSDNNKA